MSKISRFFHRFIGNLRKNRLAQATRIFPLNLPNRNVDVNFDTNVKMATDLQSRQDWNGAIAAYKKALVLRSSVDLQTRLAACCINAERRDEAKEIFRSITAKEPAHAVALLEWGRILVGEGEKWGGFQLIRSSFESIASEAADLELRRLLNTVTPYHKVEAAMAEGFDASFYLAENADVRRTTAAPDVHYLLYGWKENRKPSASFDPVYYQKQMGGNLRRQEFILAHYLQRREAQVPIGNLSGYLPWFEPVAPAADEWAGLEGACRESATRVVVILPVYKGYHETLRAIYCALAARNGQNYSLLVINDCSPDAELNAVLAELSRRALFDYHYNAFNRGFVQTVNFAIAELSAALDVILLNSDAYVFSGWFDRLIAHADADPVVATITPLSNNATICSYPLIDADNRVSLELQPAELDALAAVTNAGVSVETPTGVGFCFYMRRSVIVEIGQLDEQTFKIGYGEENDFCMRALNSGYKNIIACNVFVFHVGSVSFSATKEELFSQAQHALRRKHTNYSALVHNYMEAQPDLFARRKLDAARLARVLQGCVIIVTHKWGGGIDTYLADLMLQLNKARTPYVLFRCQQMTQVSIEPSAGYPCFAPNLSDIDLRTEWDFLGELISALKPSLFHVNSFAGLDWPCHKKLLRLIGNHGTPYLYIVHDYSAISHAYQLLRPDHVYAGIPSIQERRRWASMKMRDESLDVCDPDDRLRSYQAFLTGASRIEAPSQTAKSIFEAEFVDLEISVVAHEDHLPDMPVISRRDNDGIIRVAILGAIGPHKGSDVLAGLALDARYRKLNIDYILVGYSNKDDILTENGVKITGSYASETEAIEHIFRIRPDVLFIPSIWPETFCYTLSFAIKMKIPPVVFDLGAQAERISQLQIGVRIPTRLMQSPSELNDYICELDLDALWETSARAT